METEPKKKRGRPRKIQLEVKPELPQESVYEMKLTIGTDVYVGKGATALEALQELTRNAPQKIFQKSQLVISHGEAKKELRFMPFQLKRIFFPSFQAINIKWIAAGIK